MGLTISNRQKPQKKLLPSTCNLNNITLSTTSQKLKFQYFEHLIHYHHLSNKRNLSDLGKLNKESIANDLLKLIVKGN